jgi:uncharacterized UPF0160 family protein
MQIVQSFSAPSPSFINIATHGGIFHADEVLSVAILSSVLNKPINLLRSRDISQMPYADYVLDMGGEYIPGHGKFDHHQRNGAGCRADGIPYATAGLIWRHFGERYVKTLTSRRLDDCLVPSVCFRVDKTFISPIDALDTGYVRPAEGDLHFSQAVSMFNSDPSNRDLQDSQFLKAVEWVSHALQHAVLSIIDVVSKEAELSEIIKNSHPPTLVLEAFLPWKGLLKGRKDNRFKRVIYPSPEGGSWCVQVVEGEGLFPDEWRGLRGVSLSQVTGVDGSVFCHSGGFLVCADSLEGAKKLADLSL